MADGTPPAEEAFGLFSSIVGAVGSSLRYAADTVNRCPTLRECGSKVKVWRLALPTRDKELAAASPGRRTAAAAAHKACIAVRALQSAERLHLCARSVMGFYDDLEVSVPEGTTADYTGPDTMVRPLMTYHPCATRPRRALIAMHRDDRARQPSPSRTFCMATTYDSARSRQSGLAERMHARLFTPPLLLKTRRSGSRSSRPTRTTSAWTSRRLCRCRCGSWSPSPSCSAWQRSWSTPTSWTAPPAPRTSTRGGLTAGLSLVYLCACRQYLAAHECTDQLLPTPRASMRGGQWGVGAAFVGPCLRLHSMLL